MESDSLLVIKKEISTSWQIKEGIDDIHFMLSEGHLQFNHSFRESNIPTHFLANLAEHEKKTSLFTKESTKLQNQGEKKHVYL